MSRFEMWARDRDRESNPLAYLPVPSIEYDRALLDETRSQMRPLVEAIFDEGSLVGTVYTLCGRKQLTESGPAGVYAPRPGIGGLRRDRWRWFELTYARVEYLRVVWSGSAWRGGTVDYDVAFARDLTFPRFGDHSTLLREPPPPQNTDRYEGYASSREVAWPYSADIELRRPNAAAGLDPAEEWVRALSRLRDMAASVGVDAGSPD